MVSLALLYSGPSGVCVSPLKGQELRSYINDDLLVSIRIDTADVARSIKGFKHVIESATKYLRTYCPPDNHMDSIRTAYIYSHLAVSFDRLDNSKKVIKTYLQGRFYLGLLPDPLVIRLLRGVAWAYAKQQKYQEAERLALRSMIIAHQTSDREAQQESWLCYLSIVEARKGALTGTTVPSWLLPWLISGFLIGAVAGLLRVIKKHPALHQRLGTL